MKYAFSIIIEEDKDGWFAYAPILKSQGAYASGRTQNEATRNIKNVIKLIVDDTAEHSRRLSKS